LNVKSARSQLKCIEQPVFCIEGFKQSTLDGTVVSVLFLCR
jgi:hypothetical protein